VKKALWVGDGSVPTGFARVNEPLAAALKAAGWDVHWLMINASGDAIPLQKEYSVYPASLGGADAVGVERIAEVAAWVQPDLIVMHNDAWLTGAYLQRLRELALPAKLIGYAPPDSPNQPYGKAINDLDLLLCPTAFGVRELRRGGYTGRAAVMPYGVDRSIYRPLDQRASRESLGFPTGDDAVIFGRADRNTKRKRHDEMIRLFAAWRQRRPDVNAYLHLHCKPVDVGWDLPQLVEYYELRGRVFFSGDLEPSVMLPQSALPTIFSAWTAHWSTTMGEGFGLVALESAACGAAQILPNWSAYGEWMKDGAFLVEVDRTIATDHGINTMGALVNDLATFAALDAMTEHASTWGLKALDVASDPRYDWQTICRTFLAHVERVMGDDKGAA
jgi:glycosyltransferase involved in cell wall biosynthesis